MVVVSSESDHKGHKKLRRRWNIPNSIHPDGTSFNGPFTCIDMTYIYLYTQRRRSTTGQVQTHVVQVNGEAWHQKPNLDSFPAETLNQWDFSRERWISFEFWISFDLLEKDLAFHFISLCIVKNLGYSKEFTFLPRRLILISDKHHYRRRSLMMKEPKKREWTQMHWSFVADLRQHGPRFDWPYLQKWMDDLVLNFPLKI